MSVLVEASRFCSVQRTLFLINHHERRSLSPLQERCITNKAVMEPNQSKNTPASTRANETLERLKTLGEPQKYLEEVRVRSLMQRYDTRWGGDRASHTIMRNELLAHGLPIISKALSAPLPTKVGTEFAGWTFRMYLDYVTGEHHAALVLGDFEREAQDNLVDFPVRIHSSAKASDIFFGTNSNSYQRFENAMEEIIRAGRGALLYLEQDGRGFGAPAMLRALNERYQFATDGSIEAVTINGKPLSIGGAYERIGMQRDKRDYLVAAHILRDLGVNSVSLMTNSASKVAALTSGGIAVTLWGDDYKFEPMLGPDRTRLSKSSPEYWSRFEQLRELCAEREIEAGKPWESVADNRARLSLLGKPLTKSFGSAPIPTAEGDWTYHAFGDYSSGEIHRMLVYGDTTSGALGDGQDVLVRVHSSCKTNEIFHSTDCECQEELRTAMQEIRQEGRGVIVYLDQEGRGTGVVGRMAQLSHMFYFSADGSVATKIDEHTGRPIQTVAASLKANFPAEVRDFTVATEMLRSVGVESVRMMTNNPLKIRMLEEGGIPVKPQKIVVDIHKLADPGLLKAELRNKAEFLGHRIEESDLDNPNDNNLSL